jgi:uncharacterized FlgJ-related protein
MTTIKGIPSQFNQALLEEKQNQLVDAFLKTSQSSYRLKANLPHDFLNEYARLSALGYSLTDFPIIMSPANYSALLHQPQAILDPLIADIRAKVKSEYVAELQAEHERYKLLLIEQLRAADIAKAEKTKAEQEAKQLAKYEKLANECYTPLSIPED